MLKEGGLVFHIRAQEELNERQRKKQKADREKRIEQAERMAEARKREQAAQKARLIEGERGRKVKIRIPQFSANSVITESVHTGRISLKCNKQHFEKHFAGTKQYQNYLQMRAQRGWGKQSRLIIDFEKAQQLILKYSGTGLVVGTKNGKPKTQEDVNFGEVIGYYVYEGKEYPTSKGRIHYGKNGAHIVPIRGAHFD